MDFLLGHHHYIWDVLQRQSTLQTAEGWVNTRETVERIGSPTRTHRIDELDKLDRVVHFFGDHIAFDKETWLREAEVERYV